MGPWLTLKTLAVGLGLALGGGLLLPHTDAGPGPSLTPPPLPEPPYAVPIPPARGTPWAILIPTTWDEVPAMLLSPASSKGAALTSTKRALAGTHIVK